jgi:hypothetical protein
MLVQVAIVSQHEQLPTLYRRNFGNKGQVGWLRVCVKGCSYEICRHGSYVQEEKHRGPEDRRNSWRRRWIGIFGRHARCCNRSAEPAGVQQRKIVRRIARTDSERISSLARSRCGSLERSADSGPKRSNRCPGCAILSSSPSSPSPPLFPPSPSSPSLVAPSSSSPSSPPPPLLSY